MAITSPALELDAQYRALREEAGMVDRSDRGKLRVSGPEAAEYLHSQLTNEIEALAEGEGCYAALLDRKGHLQADARLLRLARDDLWLDSEATGAAALRRHLETYKIGREVEIEDVGEERALTSVIGPAAAELTGAGALAPEHAHRLYERGGVEITAVATDVGLDLITGREQGEAVRELLAAAGVPAVSEDAAEILRVESGRPRFGREMSPATMPAEAGIVERAVSFTKGCYIGQEPVARLHYKGSPNRRLCGLRLSADADAGELLRLGEREVGAIGTAVLSPAFGPIALAVVRKEAGIGCRLEVGDRGITAEVVEPPFGG